MPTLSLAAAPPPQQICSPAGVDQAQQLADRLAGTQLRSQIERIFVPMIIDEDSFRPGEFVDHEDPLDFHAALRQSLPELGAMVAQVTPFTHTADLERRVVRARAQGVDRMIFVGVPREYDEADVVGLYPVQALSYFADSMPGRGVITIQSRPHEHDRLLAKVNAGANFAVSQLVYGDAIVDLLASLQDSWQTTPEIILSFGYIPATEARSGLIRWLIQDDNAHAEMDWVSETAQCDLGERTRRLVNLYRDVVGRVRDLGIEPGINFEAPYGLSQAAVETFEAMLESYNPRAARATQAACR